MRLRQAFHRWLIPAAFVLPLWLLVGWGVFDAGGWAFLWVLFIAIPSVFIAQLLMTLLVRSRPSVRADRALSWADVAGFTVWHALTITVGFYPEQWFPLVLTGAIVAAIGMFWLSLTQLWREARDSGGIRVVTTSWRAEPAAPPVDRPGDGDVFVIREH